MTTKRSGFTLLEMLLVMLITVTSLLGSWPQIRRTMARNEERQFWRTFRQAWQTAQIRAKVRNAATYVVYRHDQNPSVIIFSWSGGCERIIIPKTLAVRKFDDIEMKTSGYVSPKTEEFISSLDGTIYRMRIQLAWGSYHVQASQN